MEQENLLRHSFLTCGPEVSVFPVPVVWFFFLTHGRCYNHISCVDVAPLIMFLKEIEDGTIVMMASFDDASTKWAREERMWMCHFTWRWCLPSYVCYCRLNDEAKSLISNLGSSVINALGFRDNWIFVGGKGIRTKSPFEQVIRPFEPMFTFIPLGFPQDKGCGSPIFKESILCQEMSCMLV